MKSSTIRTVRLNEAQYILLFKMAENVKETENLQWIYMK